MTATHRDNIKQIEQGDPIWARIRRETRDTAAADPILASFLHATILNHDELESALSFHLANLLGSPTAPAMMLREVILEALQDDSGIRSAIRDDLNAIIDRDSACHELYLPFLYFKGFQALQIHRIGHWLWTHNVNSLASSIGATSLQCLAAGSSAKKPQIRPAKPAASRQVHHLRILRSSELVDSQCSSSAAACRRQEAHRHLRGSILLYKLGLSLGSY